MAEFTPDFEDTLKGSLNNEELSFILPSTQDSLSGQLLLRTSVALQGFSTECYEQEPMPSTPTWPTIASNCGSLQEQSHMGHGSPNLADPALWVFNPLQISSLHQVNSSNTELYGLRTWETMTTNCQELHYSPPQFITNGCQFDSPLASSLDALYDTSNEGQNHIPTPYRQNSVFALHSIPGSEVDTPGSSSFDSFFDIGDECDYEVPTSYELPSYFTPRHQVNAPFFFAVDEYFDLKPQSGCRTTAQTTITEESSIAVSQPKTFLTTSGVSGSETVTQPPWIPEDIETMGYQDDERALSKNPRTFSEQSLSSAMSETIWEYQGTKQKDMTTA
ncbi:hypothetical protein BP5796_12107 [Coleophoma crateriformis]|uniref:Uncharacterized protein n=1 Tax=Coleophoma crateriformis TaxID=565419 RepID=A0A3D8QBG0_9HELO|nr:hypothetical protein BP5796_12107 [Coleophoma crateriformis]